MKPALEARLVVGFPRLGTTTWPSSSIRRAQRCAVPHASITTVARGSWAKKPRKPIARESLARHHPARLVADPDFEDLLCAVHGDESCVALGKTRGASSMAR
jgi:hypothetical protein